MSLLKIDKISDKFISICKLFPCDFIAFLYCARLISSLSVFFNIISDAYKELKMSQNNIMLYLFLKNFWYNFITHQSMNKNGSR